jgi:hypothetical protein
MNSKPELRAVFLERAKKKRDGHSTAAPERINAGSTSSSLSWSLSSPSWQP